jgi:hypothetical protein
MQWREVTTDGVLILELSGEIDLQHSPRCAGFYRRGQQTNSSVAAGFHGVKC